MTRSEQESSSELRDDLAKKIRRIYTWERRFYQSRITGEASHYTPSERWDGSTKDCFGMHDGDEKPKTSTWLRLADLVLRHRLDPSSFIRAQFDSSQRWLPLPNQILGAKALDKYRRDRRDAAVGLQVALATQQSCFKLSARQYKRWFPKSSARRVWVLVLLNKELEMTALFRYCIATSEKMTRTAKRFRDAAAVQYTRQREAYDTAWGTLLPEGFADEAEAIYRRILKAGI